MLQLRSARWWLWVVVCWFGCAGPTGEGDADEEVNEGCEDDAGCDPGQRCDVERGVCVEVSSCVAGASQPCGCADGGQGAQVCGEDGEFGPCVCDDACPASEQVTWYPDLDGDGAGDENSLGVQACEAPDQHVRNRDDCNDAQAAIHPGADEIAGDGFDQDCDGQELCYSDPDGDGFRAEQTEARPAGGCTREGVLGAEAPAGDCAPNDASIHPGADEIAGDGVDQDCDGQELCYADQDSDGFRTSATLQSEDADCDDEGEARAEATAGDCDDDEAAIHPDADEVCDGVDNDCADGADGQGVLGCVGGEVCQEGACACPEGYAALDAGGCEDLDECQGAEPACPENSACSNEEGSFSCSCEEGFAWDGQACSDVDECELGMDDCAQAALCDNEAGGYTCECRDGYEGDGRACDDIDECARALDDCDERATCLDQDGGYTCACLDGYEGDGRTCADIDECARGLDDCATDARCDDTEGGYTCACLDGYEGDGRVCDDVDECAQDLDDCALRATCRNEAGGYACACERGYEGDGRTCDDIDECERGLDECANGTLCANTPGAYVCRDVLVDAARLTGTLAVEVEPGAETPPLSGRAFEAGLTEITSGETTILAQLGYGPAGSDPEEAGWTWLDAAFAGDAGSEDAYVGTLQIAQAGEYDATFRFSLDGTRWVVADRDGSGNGYDPAQAISVLVRPRPVGAPSLEEVAPTEGLAAGGYEVVLRGEDFDPTARVSFGGTVVTPTWVSAQELRAQAPAGEVGWVDVAVQQGGQESALREGFVYLAGQARNSAQSLWGPNRLEELAVTWTQGSLYVWLRASVEDQNALVLYLDRDLGAGTGVVNLSGNGEGSLMDNTGSVDNALNGRLALAVEGFGAELGFGMRGMQTSDRGFQDRVGWRQLAGRASDFAWVDTSEAPVSLLDDGRVQLILPWTTLYGMGGRPEGARLGLFVRLTNAEGALYNNAQTLPLDDPEDPATIGQVMTLE